MDSRVHEIWNGNVQTLQRIVRGKRFNQDEYLSAVTFFEALTGLAARDNMSFVGRLPNENLELDLDQWQEWYVQNANQLKWDPTAGRVVRSGV